jgi:hypothetical protein
LEWKPCSFMLRSDDGDKGESYMDCGYFMGGGNGLVWFPPIGHEVKEPVLIPWSEIPGLDERKESQQESEQE